VRQLKATYNLEFAICKLIQTLKYNPLWAIRESPLQKQHIAVFNPCLLQAAKQSLPQNTLTQDGAGRACFHFKIPNSSFGSAQDFVLDSLFQLSVFSFNFSVVALFPLLFISGLAANLAPPDISTHPLRPGPQGPFNKTHPPFLSWRQNEDTLTFIPL